VTLFSVPSDAVAATADDCYTPRWVFDAMGLEFDLDAAAPFGGPLHVPAKRWYTAAEDGLTQPWDGLTFAPWAHKWAATPRACLMGTYTPGTAWFPFVFAAADAVAFITCEFLRPGLPPIRPMHGLFVAFRGVGVEPAGRLAAADKFGAVLYGQAVP
jgi:hypothetical protein